MIVAVDVQYTVDNAIAGGVVFNSWQDEEALKECISVIEDVAAYEPGEFYKRELPCILRLLAEHRLEPDCIVIDGYVYLDGHSKAGLGRHLFDALHGAVPVLGVAKKRYMDIGPQFELVRGASSRPLYVTAVGLDLEQAKGYVLSMHGVHRLPTLLKRVDRLCRGIRAG
jgi:deoxyribonuclease V